MIKKIITYFTIAGLIVSALMVKAHTHILKSSPLHHKTIQNSNDLLGEFNKIARLTVNHNDKEDDVDYILASHISLDIDGKIIKLPDITPAKLTALSGYRFTSATKFAEMYNAKVTTYKHHGLEISFIKSELLGITVIDKSASFVFTQTNGRKMRIKPGDSTTDLSNIFSTSFRHKTYDHVQVFIKTNKGVKTDALITFDISHAQKGVSNPSGDNVTAITLQD